MGLLRLGKPLTLEEAKEHMAYVRQHGILQFLHVFNHVKDIENDGLKWGDEIECPILKVDPEKKEVRISVRASELRAELESKEATSLGMGEGVTWHPEFGGWMIESTPSIPYADTAIGLLR